MEGQFGIFRILTSGRFLDRQVFSTLKRTRPDVTAVITLVVIGNFLFFYTYWGQFATVNLDPQRFYLSVGDHAYSTALAIRAAPEVSVNRPEHKVSKYCPK